MESRLSQWKFFVLGVLLPFWLAMSHSLLGAQTPGITSAQEVYGRVGKPLTYKILTRNPSADFFAKGLPAGLTLNASTGVVFGKPKKAGDFQVTIGAKNSAGGVTMPLWVRVLPKRPAGAGFIPMSTAGQPALPRFNHSQVWTGRELLVWGGMKGGGKIHGDGGAYSPGTDRWRSLSQSGAPGARCAHTAVWTGSEMIVWGGRNARGNNLRSGAIYHPRSNSWRAMEPGPFARSSHTAVWTGKEMIIWGGLQSENTGAAYDPGKNSWRRISSVGAPPPRAGHEALWTGSQMVIWGGAEKDGDASRGSGAFYNPASDSWEEIPKSGAPSGGDDGTLEGTKAVELLWVKGRLVVLTLDFNNEAGIYDPANGVWKKISMTGFPKIRRYMGGATSRGLFILGSSWDKLQAVAYSSSEKKWQSKFSRITGSFEGRRGTWAPEAGEYLVFGGRHAGTNASGNGGASGKRGFCLWLE